MIAKLAKLSTIQSLLLGGAFTFVITLILFFSLKKKDSSLDDIYAIQQETSAFFERKIDSIISTKDLIINGLKQELVEVSKSNEKKYSEFLMQKDSFERRINWRKTRKKHEVITYRDSTLESIVRKLSD